MNAYRNCLNSFQEVKRSGGSIIKRQLNFCCFSTQPSHRLSNGTLRNPQSLHETFQLDAVVVNIRMKVCETFCNVGICVGLFQVYDHFDGRNGAGEMIIQIGRQV